MQTHLPRTHNARRTSLAVAASAALALWAFSATAQAGGPLPMGLVECDPDAIYVGQTFLFPGPITFTHPIVLGHGIVFDSFTNTKALFVFMGQVGSQYEYAAFGQVGDMCP